jgi:glycosyltransferase involved in cell wall biosynthesis
VAGRLARELAGRGFDVTWLASNATEPPTVDEPFRVEPVGIWNITERRLGVPWPVLSPRAVARLWRAVGAADAVLLHDSLYMTSVVSFLAARAARKPLLVVQHIGQIRYASPVLRYLMVTANCIVAGPVLTGANQVVFISDVVRAYFGKLSFRAEPLLIFNGVDTEVFRPAIRGERAAARANFGIAPEEKVALFVGRFVEKKGINRLRSAARLRPEVTFAFAGWGMIDPGSWGLSNVRVLSDLAGASLAELYRASDVFVFDVESSDQHAVAESLVTAIDSSLSTDEPAIAGQRAQFVRARYSWSAAADQYAAILSRLVVPREIE